MRGRLILGALFLLTSSSIGSAADLVVELDPASSSIRFELGATMHSVHGTAALSHGRFAFDPATGNANGEIVVDARSADTENGKRDKKMHAQVLESAQYPEIVLRPVRISGQLPPPGTTAAATVEGELQLHGTSHLISFPAQVSTAEGDVVAVSAQFEIPYVEWGLDDPSTFILRVSKEVTVTLEARGRLLAD